MAAITKPHPYHSPFLDQLKLPQQLRQRIHCIHDDQGTSIPRPNKAFVLYLPTVCLRKEHNPGLALSCHLANHLKLPLVILATVLDDGHLPTHKISNKDGNLNNDTRINPIVAGTARRMTFHLQALQQCSQDWQNHGAGVAVRIHGPKARTPHHLSLLSRGAACVVVDEPFVHPYLSFVQSVERAGVAGNVAVYRVDGSTTVAPLTQLTKRWICNTSENGQIQRRVVFDGVPDKAWKWKQKTQPHLKTCVDDVVLRGHFDVPPLQCKLPPDFFCMQEVMEEDPVRKSVWDCLPADWRNSCLDTPPVPVDVESTNVDATQMTPQRPWSVTHLTSITDISSWTLQFGSLYYNMDFTVPPCSQTDGSMDAGMTRWREFVQTHLKYYANTRNNIRKPHSVSRMSCYLNVGIVSIYQLVADLWQEQQLNKTSSYSRGYYKFHDEVVKWREISYAHVFGTTTEYHRVSSLPSWSRTYLQKCCQAPSAGRETYTMEKLASCQSGSRTWNAMQEYLVSTGELHNNARMTWGKTLVHWLKYSSCNPNHVLDQLCYINDRFALDGLSPPSYAGLLWCLGWCDKPGSGGSISTKGAERYKVGQDGFEEAKRILLAGTRGTAGRSVAAAAVVSPSPPQPPIRTLREMFSQDLGAGEDGKEVVVIGDLKRDENGGHSADEQQQQQQQRSKRMKRSSLDSYFQSVA